MSTFPGLLEEIPKISIDRFDGSNLSSKAFFLSHFHTDHMQGLASSFMHSVLEQHDDVFLHCSEITALFLSYNQLRGLKHKVRILPMNTAYPVNVPELGIITVTALPAGHCPGSVMFLFNYGLKNILYTGDFRMTCQDILLMKGLRTDDGALLHIDALYLDTTFSSPAFRYLPTRDESLSELMKMCRSWLDRGCNHVIDLRSPGKITVQTRSHCTDPLKSYVGVEYVLIKLFEEFGQPIHVSEDIYQKYARMPDLAPAITGDENSKFHVCVPGRSKKGRSEFLKKHPNHKATHVCSLKLCALHAEKLSKGEKISWYSEEQDLHRIVYSSHSSLSELLEIIEVLQPSKIVPCVLRKHENISDVLRHLVSEDTLEKSLEKQNPFEDISLISDEEIEFEGELSVNIVEDKSDDNPIAEKNHKNGKRAAQFTISKYNIEESSDEQEPLSDEKDADELPPFRWDCFFDARKVMGYRKSHG